MFRNKKNIIFGQSLLELLFVVAVISITIVAIVSLSSRLISNEDFSQNKTLATEYAQEVSEWLRSERDIGWSSFDDYGGNTYCLTTASWPGSSGSCDTSDPTDAISGTIFFREATLTLTTSDTMDVEVKVTWSDSRGEHTVTSNTKLTDWRK